jgi:hypothetical protein
MEARSSVAVVLLLALRLPDLAFGSTRGQREYRGDGNAIHGLGGGVGATTGASVDGGVRSWMVLVCGGWLGTRCECGGGTAVGTWCRTALASVAVWVLCVSR